MRHSRICGYSRAADRTGFYIQDLDIMLDAGKLPEKIGLHCSGDTLTSMMMVNDDDDNDVTDVSDVNDDVMSCHVMPRPAVSQPPSSDLHHTHSR